MVKIKKIKVEFEKDVGLKYFDEKIDRLLSVFPLEMPVIITVDTLKDKSIATLCPNPDQSALERKVWEIK